MAHTVCIKTDHEDGSAVQALVLVTKSTMHSTVALLESVTWMSALERIV